MIIQFIFLVKVMTRNLSVLIFIQQYTNRELSSANKKYLEYLKEMQRSLINILHNRKQRTDPSATPESTSKGVETCYGF